MSELILSQLHYLPKLIYILTSTHSFYNKNISLHLCKALDTVMSPPSFDNHKTVNNAIVQSYWEIGQYIVEYEQKGHAKAEYGSDVLNRLSRDMTVQGKTD